MPGVLVFVELVDGAPSDGSLQCLAKGRELADASGAKLACVACGSGIAERAPQLVAHGADTVLVADHPGLRDYASAPFRKILSEVLAERAPALFLLPASTQGNDLAPWLAAVADAACVLDCQGVAFEGGAPVASRPEFDRKVMTRWVAAPGRTLVATLRDGATEAATPRSGRAGEVVPLAVDLSTVEGKSRVIRRDVARRTVNLREAKVVVAAGAGLGGKENLPLVEQLAAALGGEVGATRAAVDAGWVSAERQIGQTGVTVRPRLYVACGVSGAVQHRVGMLESKTIVAINTDPEAPIFKISHFRVLGDVKTVVPKILRLLG